MDQEPKHPVRTTKKTLQLMELLKRKHVAGISDLAQEIEMSKSTVHNHLNTLVSAGFVTKDGDQYQLSLKLLEFGGHLRDQMDLYKVAKSEIKGLAQDSNELVNLAIEENGRLVYLTRSKGDLAVDVDTYTGYRTHMHNNAAGKAILAHESPEKVNRIIKRQGLPEVTENTITSEEELLKEIELIQDQGYAQDNEERLEGLRSVAAPIKSSNNMILGAVSVSAPTSRMSKDVFHEKIPEMVQNTANVIELDVKFR